MHLEGHQAKMSHQRTCLTSRNQCKVLIFYRDTCMWKAVKSEFNSVATCLVKKYPFVHHLIQSPLPPVGNYMTRMEQSKSVMRSTGILLFSISISLLTKLNLEYL